MVSGKALPPIYLVTGKRALLKLRQIFGQRNARVFVNNTTTMTKKCFFSVDLLVASESSTGAINQRDFIGLGQSTIATA